MKYFPDILIYSNTRSTSPPLQIFDTSTYNEYRHFLYKQELRINKCAITCICICKITSINVPLLLTHSSVISILQGTAVPSAVAVCDCALELFPLAFSSHSEKNRTQVAEHFVSLTKVPLTASNTWSHQHIISCKYNQYLYIPSVGKLPSHTCTHARTSYIDARSLI